MKVACTADWHIHEFQDFSKQLLVKWDKSLQRYTPNIHGREMNSRLFHILSGICDIRDYCVSHHVTQVLHAGDVFHKRGSISVSAFNAAHRVIQTFLDAGVQLTIIAGNHDQVDASDAPETSIHTLDNLATIIESPAVTTISTAQEMVSILCLPYIRNKKVAMDHFQELVQKVDTRRSILLAHCGVTGGAVGSGMKLLTDDWSMGDLRWDKWMYVVLGHYHRPQLLAHNAFYCGTLVQNSFSDELPAAEHSGYNGFFVVDTDTQGDVQFVPVYQPRFVTVTSPAGVANEVDYYRVQLPAESIEELPELGDNVRLEMEKTYDVDCRSAISLGDTIEEAATKYHQENYQGDYPDALKLGLYLLSAARM